MGKEEISERIKELYEEVRAQTKSKVKEEEKDKPRLHTKPPSGSLEKKKRRKRARGQAVIDGPSITLKELAYEFELTPKEVRRALRRDTRIQKPGGRWEWPEGSKDLKRIRKILSTSKK